MDGQIVPQRVNRAIAGFAFSRKGEASRLATRRYHEIQARLGRSVGDDPA